MVRKEVPGGPRLCEALVTLWTLLFAHAQDLITLDRIFLGLDFGELRRSRSFFQKREHAWLCRVGAWGQAEKYLESLYCVILSFSHL